MGKIIETQYHDTVGKITTFADDLVNNPFYTLNDKKPSIVTYYNINKEASSLDEGSKLAYDNIGEDSPIRFNKIDDFIIYGFNRIELTTDMEEFGLEADKITGDCYVLPNTIIPYEGDYFQVDHIKDSTWLFIVTDVQQDTLKNGSNAYKLQYKLEYVDDDRIKENVVEDYKLIEKREGTNVVRVVETDKYKKAKKMDEMAVMLKHYFNELFYNEKVQTFTYVDLTEWRVYDPFMIEFLIRNKILDNGLDSFVYVCHQIDVPKTFIIDYDKTFYRAFEEKSIGKLMKSKFSIQLEDLKSYGTTFSSRYEAYFKAVYVNPPASGYKGYCIPQELIYDIQENKLIDTKVKDENHELPYWKNILVKYFNGGDFTDDEVESIETLDFGYSMKAFYIIPLLILALEDAIESILK